MATKKSGKTNIKLWGGPFAGASFPMSIDRTSITFKCGKFLGRYENGKWKSDIQEPIQTNHNVVLGYN